MEVMIGGVNVPVTITRKSMRNITLRVGRNGELRVSCPKYTPHSVQAPLASTVNRTS